MKEEKLGKEIRTKNLIRLLKFLEIFDRFYLYSPGRKNEKKISPIGQENNKEISLGRREEM